MNYPLPIYNVDTAPADSKPLLKGVAAAYGFIPNALGMMAESPAMLEAYLNLNALFEKTQFSNVERFIVMLATSRETECPYCVPAVSTLAKMQGVDADTIRRLRERQPLQDKKLEALRRFTWRLVRQRGWVTEKDIEEFTSAGYTHRHVFEVILIAMTKFLAIYSNHALGTPLDEAFLPERWGKVA